MNVIYKISFKGCKRIYIGQSINIKNRIKYHKYFLKTDNHYNIKIQRAYNKYGIENMCIDIIEVLDDATKMNDREVFFVAFFDSFNNGLNCSSGGGQGALRVSQKIIYQYCIKTGEQLNRYTGYMNASRGTDVGESHIRQCCYGLLKTAKGFHFSLENKIPKQVLKDIVYKNTTDEYKDNQRKNSLGKNNAMFGKKRPDLAGENNHMVINRVVNPKVVMEMNVLGKKQNEIAKELKTTQSHVSFILRQNNIRKYNTKCGIRT